MSISSGVATIRPSIMAQKEAVRANLLSMADISTRPLKGDCKVMLGLEPMNSMAANMQSSRMAAGAPQDTPLNPILTVIVERILGLSAQINAGAARSPRTL